MKNAIYRVIPALSAAVLLLALVSCSGNETPQGTTAAKPEEKAAVAQSQTTSQQVQPAAVQQENQPSEKAEKSAETMQPTVSETAEITGTVMLSDAGVVIQTDQGEYGVTGKDLTDMAGKTVTIVGTLQESEGRQIIQVISAAEAK
jgi:hypothetical protein